MAYFIMLTATGGNKPFVLNLDNVLEFHSVNEPEGSTMVVTMARAKDGRHSIQVQESLSLIMGMIPPEMHR